MQHSLRDISLPHVTLTPRTFERISEGRSIVVISIDHELVSADEVLVEEGIWDQALIGYRPSGRSRVMRVASVQIIPTDPTLHLLVPSIESGRVVAVLIDPSTPRTEAPILAFAQYDPPPRTAPEHASGAEAAGDPATEKDTPGPPAAPATSPPEPSPPAPKTWLPPLPPPPGLGEVQP